MPQYKSGPGVSRIVPWSSLLVGLGWLCASPLEGWGVMEIFSPGLRQKSLRMLGPLGGVPGGVSCWLSFVSLCPLLCLLWLALTWLVGFVLEF
jgi:hypothetical protein